MNDLVKAALDYRALGFSVVPVRPDKSSFGEWKDYQERFMTDMEIERAFNDPSTHGIAVACGKVSGDLEVIDVDSRNDLSNTLYDRFYASIEQQLTGFIRDKAVLAGTRNQGFHIFYRCPAVDRSTVLARRPTTARERLLNPKETLKILIETRANSGYVLVAPSPGYQFFQGDLSSVSTIRPADRETLFTVARSFNTYSEIPYARNSHSRLKKPKLGSPMDDYNQRGNVVELLKKHGWIVVAENSERTVFRRPGKTGHHTSGDFDHRLNLFGVFTTSTDFIPEAGYSPSAVYAVLECNGDFSLAAKKLIKEGYGTAYRHMF